MFYDLNTIFIKDKINPMNITIRPTTVQDASQIAQHRRLMFAESADNPDMDLMEQQYAVWVATKLATGEYQGWFAQDDGFVVAGVGLWLREWPPIPLNPTGKQGFVENVYTLPAYRRQGIARQLMVAMLNWVRDSKAVYEVELHPTDTARPLYTSLGFEGNIGLMSQWFGPKNK
jgi:GNAT superfamily N-acetyltransferase